MKHPAVTLVALALTLPIMLNAQRVSEEDIRCRVVDVDIETVRWDDIYPTIRRLHGVHQGGRREFLRLALQLEFEDRRDRRDIQREGPPFVSLMEVDWTVVPAMGQDDADNPRPEYSARFTRTVRYANIRGDEEHWIMIFIHPDTRRQWMEGIPQDQLYFQAVIRYGGRTRETVYSQGDDYATSEGGAPGYTPEWVGTERTISVPSGLLTRYETPFLYASDDYLLRIVQEPLDRGWR